MRGSGDVVGADRYSKYVKNDVILHDSSSSQDS